MPLSMYHTPGIYVEEKSGGAHPIQAVGTSTAAFIGVTPNPRVPKNQPIAVNNWSEFSSKCVAEDERISTPLSQAVYGFFLNGGSRCYVVNVGADNPIAGDRVGLSVLESVDEVAIVAAPGYSDPASHSALIAHCEKMLDRVAILDSPEEVKDIDLLTQAETVPVPPSRRRSGAAADPEAPAPGGLHPQQSDRGYGAFYFPWITVADPFNGELVNVAPSGHMAGIWARTDATRGVHKAPANEPIRGALNLTYQLTRDEQGKLNDAGVNCLRLFAREGIRVWGARTVADQSGEWKYLNVRRLFNMVEESIAEGTNWIVFEPNDRTLWKSIRRDIGAFLTLVWRDGGLMGATPEDAFFVKCDEETNPPEVIDAGQVVTVIGLAPVKPAEFIIFQISQSASGAQIGEGGK